MMPATWTSPPARDIGIVNRKAAAHGAILEVDRRAVQVERHLFRRDQRDAMLFVPGINSGVEIGLKPQGVLQAGAPAPRHAHAQHGSFFDFLFRHIAFDFSGRRFCQRNGHVPLNSNFAF